MQLLLLSATFFPEENPRANRWWPMAKAMAREGHQLTIIARKAAGVPDQLHLEGIRIIRVGWPSAAGKWRSQLHTPSSLGWILRRLQYLRRWTWKEVWWPDSSIFWLLPAAWAAHTYIRQHQTDGLISISLPFTAHLAALWVKKKYPELRWIADHGDPFSLKGVLPQNNETLYQRLNSQAERSVLRYADHHFVNTPALAAWFRGLTNQPISVIAHPVPAYTPTPYPTSIDSFDFYYFGNLYIGGRSPSIFLSFIDYFKQQYPYGAEQLRVSFYGPHPPVGIPGYRGVLSRNEALQKIAESPILLSLGYPHPYMLPMKLMEYIGSGRPILHIASHPDDPVIPYLQNEPVYCVLLLTSSSSFSEAGVRLQHFLHTVHSMASYTPAVHPDLRPSALAQLYLSALRAPAP